MTESMEGRMSRYVDRRRVASYWLILALLSIIVISFLSAKLFSSGRFYGVFFSAGVIVGLLVGIIAVIGLNNRIKKGTTLENAVLIKLRVNKWINFVGILLVIIGLYIISFLIGGDLVWSFLFGFISLIPFVVLLGTLMLETKFGKVYVIF